MHMSGALCFGEFDLEGNVYTCVLSMYMPSVYGYTTVHYEIMDGR